MEQDAQNQRIAIINDKQYNFDALADDVKELYMMTMECREAMLKARRKALYHEIAHKNLNDDLVAKVEVAEVENPDGTVTHTSLPGDVAH